MNQVEICIFLPTVGGAAQYFTKPSINNPSPDDNLVYQVSAKPELRRSDFATHLLQLVGLEGLGLPADLHGGLVAVDLLQGEEWIIKTVSTLHRRHSNS